MDLVFTVFTFAKTLTGEVVPQEPYCVFYSKQSHRLLKFIINAMDSNPAVACAWHCGVALSESMAQGPLCSEMRASRLGLGSYGGLEH